MLKSTIDEKKLTLEIFESDDFKVRFTFESLCARERYKTSKINENDILDISYNVDILNKKLLKYKYQRHKVYGSFNLLRLKRALKDFTEAQISDEYKNSDFSSPMEVFTIDTQKYEGGYGVENFRIDAFKFGKSNPRRLELSFAFQKANYLTEGIIFEDFSMDELIELRDNVNKYIECIVKAHNRNTFQKRLWSAKNKTLEGINGETFILREKLRNGNGFYLYKEGSCLTHASYINEKNKEVTLCDKLEIKYLDGEKKKINIYDRDEVHTTSLKLEELCSIEESATYSAYDKRTFSIDEIAKDFVLEFIILSDALENEFMTKSISWLLRNYKFFILKHYLRCHTFLSEKDVVEILRKTIQEVKFYNEA